ncbi:hypothetical protein ACOMHN_022141 [Nucella lapillus]
MMYMERRMTMQHLCVYLPVLLLLLCCAMPSLAGSPAQPMVKVGAYDVHDEQTVEDRLKVIDIMRQLQEENLPQDIREKKQNQQPIPRLERTTASGSESPVAHSSEVTGQTQTPNHRPHSQPSTTTPQNEDFHNDADSHSGGENGAHRDRNTATQAFVTNREAEKPSNSPSRLNSQEEVDSDIPAKNRGVKDVADDSDSTQKEFGSQSNENNTERRNSRSQTETKKQAGPSSETEKTDNREHSSDSINPDANKSTQAEKPNQRQRTRTFLSSTRRRDTADHKSVNQRKTPAQTNNTNKTDSGTQTKDEKVEEVGLLFEGDIMLSASEAQEVLHPGGNGNRKRKKRKVTFVDQKLWKLPIPYTFDQTERYKLNNSEVQKVKKAIAHLESLTCITFLEVNASDPKRPILSFKKDTGCWSYVGKEHAFRYQEVSTGEGCFEFGTLLHELGHAIGFWHEHSRPDREGSIRVHTERVRLGEEYNFKVESWGELDNKGVPYDVGSIMHYGSTYFSRSGREITVETVDPRQQRVLGQRQEMSFYDVKLANKAYCEGTCPDSTLQCLHEGYPDPKRCSHCRCPPGLAGRTCQTVAPSQGATCGGRLYVGPGQKYSIASPFYPGGYPANVLCPWLIQTEPGRQIVVAVSKARFMNNSRCGPYPTAVCADYLEVKYNASLGYTGARYCCGLAPEEPLRSSDNTTLVLFVTRQSGQGGFQANVTVESCGGCHEERGKGSDSAGPQPACRRREVSSCDKEWWVSKYIPCPVAFHAQLDKCNIKMRQKKSRKSNCTSEIEYCCPGFAVNNSYCYRTNNSSSSSNVTSSQGVTSSAQPSVGTNTGDRRDIGQDADTGWSAWYPWLPCSKSCGGCGVQTRVRTCDIPTQCGGKAKEQESRACNTFPCPDLAFFRCTMTRIKSYYCGWGKCYRRVTENGPCLSACCPGYVQKYGKCVPKTRP